MKRLVSIIGGAALLGALAAGSAFALPLNPNRPAAIGSGDGPSLQQILNGNFNNTINASTGQSNVGAWMQTEGDTSAYRVAFVAGHSGYLSIYSLLDPTKTASLLPRSGGPSHGAFTIDSTGTLVVNLGFGDTITNFGHSFGFFWTDTNEGYKSYTEDDKNPLSKILALSYRVADGTQLTGGLGSQLSGAKAGGGNDWVLAFEDHPNGDKDYNDAVIYIEDMAPVPEPGTLLLLGGGLLGLGLYGRKRAKKNA